MKGPCNDHIYSGSTFRLARALKFSRLNFLTFRSVEWVISFFGSRGVSNISDLGSELGTRASHFSGSLSHSFLSGSLLYSKAAHFLMKSGSLLYFQCSTPFPLPYLLSLKPYFISMVISLLNIWWS